MYEKFSKIYDSLIDEDFPYEECYKFIIERVNDLNLSRNLYLDLGCGSGKLANLLNREFKMSILVDNSEDMLQIARNRTYRNPAQFILKDVTSLKSNHKADLIVSSLDIVNYFKSKKEILSYLMNSYGNLNKKGLLIFDISSKKKLLNMDGNTFNLDKDDYFHSWDNRLITKEGESYLEMTLNIFKEVKSEGRIRGFYERIIEEQRLLIIDENFIIEEGKKLGFKVEVYNGYLMGSEDKDNNKDRIVFTMVKE